MGTIFYNADEVFEMAIQIEKNGERFYTEAAEISTEPKAKEMLQRLGAMEVEHQKVFSELRTKLSEKSIEPIVFDPDGEVGKYLRAAADSHVFNTVSGEILSENATTKEIMDTALRFEKDSIVFFLGMQDIVPQELGKDNVGRLVEEEKGHIRFIIETMGPLVKE